MLMLMLLLCETPDDPLLVITSSSKVRLSSGLSAAVGEIKTQTSQNLVVLRVLVRREAED